jgi:RNA recognition motif-containing protein
MNIYVGNLPFDATDEDLRTLFADYGTITSASVITDRDTGRSRGFGFVELADEALASKAVSQLDGHDWNGRRLTVNTARPRQTRSR